jgi:hypothetical protein
VTDSAENGFTTAHEVIINAPRTRTWQAAVDEIGKWWSDDHTVNGDAGRMSINSVPQGCFCETFENGGGVVHMNVTFVNPGIILRLTGGLGPLRWWLPARRTERHCPAGGLRYRRGARADAGVRRDRRSGARGH